MFETFTAAMMLIVFLVPGFVWRTTEGQFVYLDKRLEWEKFALGLLCRSTITYLPVSPWLYQAYESRFHQEHPVATSVIALLLILILPTLLGFLSGIARQKDWGKKIILWFGLGTFEQHNIPAAWDRVFSNITPCWVIVTLKNGGQVFGYLSPQSYASSAPEERDLFISHTVRATSGGFEFVKNTKGIYLRGDDITSIELIDKPQISATPPT